MTLYFTILPIELRDEFLEYLNKFSLINSCQDISSLQRPKCDNEDFWKRRLYGDFPLNKLSVENSRWLNEIATDNNLTQSEKPFGWQNLYIIFTYYDKYVKPMKAENMSPRDITVKTLAYAKNNRIFVPIDLILINDPFALRSDIILNPKNIDVVDHIFTEYQAFQRAILISLLTVNSKLNREFLKSATYVKNKKLIEKLLTYETLSDFFAEQNFLTVALDKKFLMESTEFYDAFTHYLDTEIYESQTKEES